MYHNGVVPYAVTTPEDGKSARVVIYPRFMGGDVIGNSLVFPVERILPGTDVNDDRRTGNTVLLELAYKTYLFVSGQEPFFFKTLDEIEILYSPVDANLCYPYAVGKEYVYLLSDDAAYTSRDNFPNRMPVRKPGQDLDDELFKTDPYVNYWHAEANGHQKYDWKPLSKSSEKLRMSEKDREADIAALREQLAELKRCNDEQKLYIAHLETKPGGDAEKEAFQSFLGANSRFSVNQSHDA